MYREFCNVSIAGGAKMSFRRNLLPIQALGSIQKGFFQNDIQPEAARLPMIESTQF